MQERLRSEGWGRLAALSKLQDSCFYRLQMTLAWNRFARATLDPAEYRRLPNFLWQSFEWFILTNQTVATVNRFKGQIKLIGCPVTLGVISTVCSLCVSFIPPRCLNTLYLTGNTPCLPVCGLMATSVVLSQPQTICLVDVCCVCYQKACNLHLLINT